MVSASGDTLGVGRNTPWLLLRTSGLLLLWWKSHLSPDLVLPKDLYPRRSTPLHPCSPGHVGTGGCPSGPGRSTRLVEGGSERNSLPPVVQSVPTCHTVTRDKVRVFRKLCSNPITTGPGHTLSQVPRHPSTGASESIPTYQDGTRVQGTKGSVTRLMVRPGIVELHRRNKPKLLPQTPDYPPCPKF